MKLGLKIILMSVLPFFLLFALLSFLATRAEGEEVVDWSKIPKEKIAFITGEVNTGVLAQAQQIEKLGGEPVIRIFINSPGGSVMAGNVFIQAMESAKARGSKLECAVSNLAASMAMHFFAHCDKRYIMKGGYLLFHEPRVGAPRAISPSEALAIYEGLIAATDDLDLYLRKQLGASDEFYEHHNIAQTLWSAGTFNKVFSTFNLILVKDIRLPEGAPSAFDPLGAPSPFGELITYDPSIGGPVVFPGDIRN